MSPRRALATAMRRHKLPPGSFEKLIESSPDIVIAVDREGSIVFYNDGAERNLGYSAQQVLGQNVVQFYPSREEAQRVMAAMRSDEHGGPGKVKSFETTLVDRWHENVPVAISGAILYDEVGLEIGSIGFAKDIREIRRRDQLATLGEVAVALCHEICTPLEVILNEVELLERFVRRVGGEDDAVVEEERIDAVRREVSKMQEIVTRLAAMAESGDYGTREYLAGRPMADIGAADESEAAHEPLAGSLSGLRVLVVDDDLGVCRSLHDLLVEEGSEVQTAVDGRAALALIEKNPVDLVISDVVMPDLDGYDLFVEIKRRGPTPVILMTGYYYDRDHIIKRSRLRGLQAVIFKKPIDPSRLKATILKECGRQAADS